MNAVKKALPVAVMGLALASWPSAAHADSGPVTVNYSAAAAAPVMQMTEDEPLSQFHPEGEGDYGYTLVTANPTAANALAAVGYPGSTIGHAGTLVEVLGGPSVSALNDPVQASAQTGTPNPNATTGTAPGPIMTASVQPTGDGDQHATATSSLSGGSLGAEGAVGNSSSTATIDFNSNTGVLAVSAQSSAGKVDVGGIVKIGSVTSSALATSTNGAAPKLSGETDFHDMSIAGQAAYVDGSGVHLGTPKAPAGPAVVASVDSALKALGMEIFFTAPHSITVGGTSYYYAASVLFFWQPPSNPKDNSFTMTLGGSGVSLSNSATNGVGAPASAGSSAAPPPVDNTTPPIVSNQAPVGTVGADGGATVAPAATSPATSLSLPASPASAATSSPTTAPRAAVTPADYALPAGIGAWWLLLAILAGLIGAGVTTRLPTLLDRRASNICPRQKTTTSNLATERPVP